ncbi:cyclic nucleotide-binding domain-containing protein 2-like isoform X3 [Asterias amurensis]|uniref:cyclic nucleotide-binding domain-containing protein 2-like isoform X3 n=1 Tax=Asterias amurensis TaxID=7602 RepID=UPI003AB61C5E
MSATNRITLQLPATNRRVAVVSQYDRKNGGSAGSRPGLNRRRTTTSLTEDEVVKPERPPGPTPYDRFKLKANAVRWLCMACISYMRSASENALKGSLLEVVQTIMAEAENEAKRTGNDGTLPRGIISSAYPDMTFDASEYQRFSKRGEGIPKKIKELLMLPEEERTKEQIENIVRSMQHVEEFAKYPPEVQKKMCEYAWYDEYGPNRVVIKEGQEAEGLYIVLSGSLTETLAGQSYLLNKGDKFGEVDLIRGSKRTSTVMTKNKVEMFCLHSEDYAEVFDTKLNIKPEACIEYLGTIPVFQMWGGLDKLLDSPVNWGIQNYRPGQVIVPDSNSNDWIYVVKSGTCDVLKRLVPGVCALDPSKRYNKEYKKAMGAIEMSRIHDNKRPGANQKIIPQIRTPQGSAGSLSAPAGRATFLTTPTVQSAGSSPSKQRTPISGIPDSIVDRRQNLKPGMWTELNKMENRLTNLKPRKMKESGGMNGCIKRGSEPDIPYCVRVAELEAGDVFGMLTILPSFKETSVSLVSQGAEAIRINKAFFVKYTDERVFTQIEMRYEPYPTQDECLDDLDLTSQWQRFKMIEVERTLHRIASAPR